MPPFAPPSTSARGATPPAGTKTHIRTNDAAPAPVIALATRDNATAIIEPAHLAKLTETMRLLGTIIYETMDEVNKEQIAKGHTDLVILSTIHTWFKRSEIQLARLVESLKSSDPNAYPSAQELSDTLALAMVHFLISASVLEVTRPNANAPNNRLATLITHMVKSQQVTPA